MLNAGYITLNLLSNRNILLNAEYPCLITAYVQRVETCSPPAVYCTHASCSLYVTGQPYFNWKCPWAAFQPCFFIFIANSANPDIGRNFGAISLQFLKISDWRSSRSWMASSPHQRPGRTQPPSVVFKSCYLYLLSTTSPLRSWY